MQALGATVEREGPDGLRVRIAGKGLRGLSEPDDVLDAGNSGTTMRLLAGVLAGQDFFSALTGDASLRRRPMGRVVEPLSRMGANIWGRGGGRLAPLAIRGGKLSGTDHTIPVASAQVKSCILLAGLFADGPTSVTEPARSRDHTELFLNYLGVPVVTDGLRVTVGMPGAPREPRPFELSVPGDPSSASFFLGAAAAIPDSQVTARRVLLNPTRAGFLSVLRRMGGDVRVDPCPADGPERCADVTVTHSRLRGFHIEASEVPALVDEIPLLAVIATCASEPSVIQGAGELRFKETDRIAAIVTGLGRMGARVEDRGDSLVVHPGPLRGAKVSSLGDHRMAMALAVAGLMAKGGSTIYDFDSVNISYPGFVEDLTAMCGAHGQDAPDTSARGACPGHRQTGEGSV
jgi:3-phosphoshikimate 1-carboxyvinyltransferase